MSHKVTPSSTKAGGDRAIVSAMFRQPEQNAAAGTNIQIHHKGVAAGSNRFTSSYKSSNSLQVAPVKLTQKASFLDKKRSGQLEPTASQEMGQGLSRTVAAYSSSDFKQANFTLGRYAGPMKSQNQSSLGVHELPANSNESRQELKERMRKTQFTFGSAIDEAKGYKGAKSLYKSAIDDPALKWEPQSNRDDTSALKKSNFTLGNKSNTVQTSEAHSQFKSMTGAHAAS